RKDAKCSIHFWLVSFASLRLCVKNFRFPWFLRSKSWTTLGEITLSRADVSILKVERLSYRYPTGQVALCDVSFSVGVHEVVGLIGPNGAGKTTLLMHMNGLLVGTSAASRGETAGAGDATPADRAPFATVEVLGM